MSGQLGLKSAPNTDVNIRNASYNDNRKSLEKADVKKVECKKEMKDI